MLDDRKELIADLKKKASAAGMVYLAPDPDREGEAIAWHLQEALGLKDEKVRRVTFNEITKKAVEKAFAKPRSIDMDWSPPRKRAAFSTASWATSSARSFAARGREAESRAGCSRSRCA